MMIGKGLYRKNIYPLYPNNPFYTNYAISQYIVSIVEGMTADNFQSFMPQAIYIDERPNLLYLKTHNKKDEEVENRLKSILFQKQKYDETQFQWFFYKYKGIICSEDWYVGIGYYELEGEFLDRDWRSEVEFNATKEYLESMLSENIDVNNISNKCMCKTLI